MFKGMRLSTVFMLIFKTQGARKLYFKKNDGSTY